MSNEVYANGMEVSCKAADGKSICAFPDVCMTPPQTPATPPGVPVPYPNTGMASDCTDGSRSVSISSQEVMLKDKSYFKKSTGNEAGSAPKKGVVSSVNTGKVYFVMWSMDVQVEGENVVRNLDMTTHNHGSTGNSPPWPYQDAIAMAVEGHPCKGMAEQIQSACSGDTDYSSSCCSARKCFLMPKEPNCCCNSASGKKMTGHHLLPSKEFVAHAGRGAPDPVTGYVSDKAPCLCVEGTSHSKRTEHGQVGCNYTVLKNEWLNNPKNLGKTYTRNQGCAIGAQSAIGKVSVPPGAQGCTAECLERQLVDGHNKMEKDGLTVKGNDPLPRSRQPEPATVEFE